MKRFIAALLALAMIFVFVSCEEKPEPPNEYTVTFNTNGKGKAPAPAKVIEGGKVTAPENPVDESFTFLGWYKEEACTNAWNFAADSVTSDVTLYAKWTLNTYTFSFVMNGHGTEVDAQTVNHGSKATKPVDPTEDDYAFWAWYTDDGYTTKYDFNAPVTSATTVFAKWTEKKTITYSTEYGTLSKDTDRVGLGLRITEPTAPTYPGYSFNGWYTAEEGGKLWNFTEDVVEADMHLYARWTQYCDVVFNMNGHGGENVTQSNKIAGNPVGQISNPSATGYEFAGWYKDASCTTPWKFDVDVITTNPLNLYAKWTPVEVAVTLLKNTGTSDGAAKATYGETSLNVTTAPVKSGATVEGFYTDSNFTKKVANADGTLIANVSGYTDASGKWTRLDATNLYARWSYTVTFVDPDNLLQSVPSSLTIKEGARLVAPNVNPKVPAETGFEYRWSTVAPGGKQLAYDFGTSGSLLTNNITLYYLYTYKNESDFTLGWYNGKRAINKCTLSSVNVVIPSNINGEKISALGIRMMEGLDSVVNITISEGIEAILINAFSNCRNLKSISIPSTVSEINGYLYSVGSSRVTNLDTLTVSPENPYFEVHDNVIYNKGCTKVIYAAPLLSSVTIKDTVTEITKYAFIYNQNLTSVTVPEGVERIGEGAFNGCKKLESIVLPDTLKSIGGQVFQSCPITSVTLPYGLEDIPRYAIALTNISSITIPETVTTFGEGALYCCSSLKDIVIEYRGGIIPYANNLLLATHKDLVIKVPADLVDAYKAAEGWSDFASKIEAIPL